MNLFTTRCIECDKVISLSRTLGANETIWVTCQDCKKVVMETSDIVKDINDYVKKLEVEQ